MPSKAKGASGIKAKFTCWLATVAPAVMNPAWRPISTGQNLLESSDTQLDAFGNVRLKDIGLFLREHIEAYFKAEGMPVVLRYFDPSYQIRSRPANCEDAILCDLFARNAIHAAMAGKTGLLIGYLHDRFIHIPIEVLATRLCRANRRECRPWSRLRVSASIKYGRDRRLRGRTMPGAFPRTIIVSNSCELARGAEGHPNPLI